MTIALIDRNPTHDEVERFRLILSTYQDGSGMLSIGNGKTLPGWRDFERTVALSFNGHTTENKSLYDVLIDAKGGYHYGISCKMRNQLKQVEKDGRVSIELSNAAGEFWDILLLDDINQQNYQKFAPLVGSKLFRQVQEWHRTLDRNQGGTIITEKSCFLSLQYDPKAGDYQLFQFPIPLPEPEIIHWSVIGRHLKGIFSDQVLIEWYGFSGGQLKYYPHQNSAIWKSEKFRLEPLPGNIGSIILNKAAAYFPDLWKLLNDKC